MSVDIYDGMNVMRRAYEKKYAMPGEATMSMRERLERTCAAAPGTQIWVWDGRDHNARRQDIYPKYKTNRTPAGEDVYAQIRLWRELLRYTPAIQIEVHGWEADDVIGTLVRKRPGIFTVHTNDMDYGQVGHLCTLKGVNMKGVPPQWVTLYKALVGDTSDAIDGIPGFGGGRWLEMEEHWAEIAQCIRHRNCDGLLAMPFKPKVKAWLAVPENMETLRAMFTITHFMNVPDDELEGGITVGQLDLMKAHDRLSEFFL